MAVAVAVVTARYVSLCTSSRPEVCLWNTRDLCRLDVRRVGRKVTQHKPQSVQCECELVLGQACLELVCMSTDGERGKIKLLYSIGWSCVQKGSGGGHPYEKTNGCPVLEGVQVLHTTKP